MSLVEPGPIRTDFNERAMATLDRANRPLSPYAAVTARAEAIRTRLERTAAGPEVTTRAIVQAALGRRPRARYVVPHGALTLLAFFTLVPTRWADALVRRILGLTPKGLAGPIAAG